MKEAQYLAKSDW